MLSGLKQLKVMWGNFNGLVEVVRHCVICLVVMAMQWWSWITALARFWLGWSVWASTTTHWCSSPRITGQQWCLDRNKVGNHSHISTLNINTPNRVFDTFLFSKGNKRIDLDEEIQIKCASPACYSMSCFLIIGLCTYAPVAVFNMALYLAVFLCLIL